MENTFFEAPEYPILNKIKTCAILFIKQAAVLLLMLLFIKITEIGFYSYTKQIGNVSIFFIADTLLHAIIYFLKSLPILFVPYLVVCFSNIGSLAHKVGNYILFALYLLLELLLAKYFFETKAVLGEAQPVYASVSLQKWLSINFYWLGSAILVLVLLWFLVRAAGKLFFIEGISAFAVLVTGVTMLFFGISAIPEGNENMVFKIKVSKSAYLIEKTYAFYFGDEPEVDIYKENYID